MAAQLLKTGLKGVVSFKVEKKHLASETGSGDTHVFATPMLVAGMEEAAVKAIADCLEPGFTSVGTHINVYHRLASALGMIVSFEAILEKISPNGKGLQFRVHAKDENGNIGEGLHERVIVNKDAFEKQAEARFVSAQAARSTDGSTSA